MVDHTTWPDAHSAQIERHLKQLTTQLAGACARKAASARGSGPEKEVDPALTLGTN